MGEPARIEDIQERVQDFAAALRSAGAAETAQRIERYTAGFVRSTEVRRSVAAILEQLRYFREYPEELPDLPIVQVAANRLEDVCREALSAGLIEAARPSLRAASKRKLGVVLTTLAAAGLCFALPLGLIMFGVDLDDMFERRVSEPVRLPQGEEAEITINVLVNSADPGATKRVQFYVREHCPAGDLGDGIQCKAAEPREFAGVLRSSYEITAHSQVYGLFVGFDEGELVGSVGKGTVRLAATWDTPEGRYELPLSAAFVGYTPERCSLLDRALDRCTSGRTGPDALHADLPVPTVMIDVVKGDRARVAGAKQRKEQERQQERAQAAEQRASELAENVVQIKAVIDDTQRMLRKQQWELMRERVDKLTRLFSPLDALVVAGGEPVPAEVEGLRARFEEQRRQLQAFEDRAFDAAFAATRSNPPAATPELLRAARGSLLNAAESGDAQEQPVDARLAEVARKLRISPEYLEAIYAGHAEQLETRLAQAEAARRASEQAAQTALLRRCGELPRNAFNEVKAYINAMGRSVRVRVRLNECMTPRLTDKHCWTVVCQFDELVPGELTDTSRPHKWTFLLKNARVIDQLEKAEP